jgi:hypothetical protein
MGTEEAAMTITPGTLLRWLREIFVAENGMDDFLSVMRCSAAQWQRWEDNIEPLPIERALEISHRFSVSLNFLCYGLLDGIAPVVRAQLLSRHPELESWTPPGHRISGPYPPSPETFKQAWANRLH